MTGALNETVNEGIIAPCLAMWRQAKDTEQRIADHATDPATTPAGAEHARGQLQQLQAARARLEDAMIRIATHPTVTEGLDRRASMRGTATSRPAGAKP